MTAPLVMAGIAVLRQHRRLDGQSDGSRRIESDARYRRFEEVSATVPWTTIDGPLRVSPINPRYFTNRSGRAIYLTGSHTWPNFQDGGVTDPPRPFAWVAYLDMLHAHHLNMIKLWRFEQTKFSSETPGDFYLEPSPYLRVGPGTALDGKLKFDLMRFNRAYFSRMRRRISDARARGIYVAIMLFDGWSVEVKQRKPVGNPWLGHPFNAANNINGIDGDSNHDNAGVESHTLAIPEVLALQKAYVRQVIDVVNDLDNVLYEVSNEDRGTTAALAWQYYMVEYIHKYEKLKPNQHPVGMTSLWPDGANTELFAGPAEWIAPNGSLDNTPSATGAKVILNDTDHLCGVCGEVSWIWKSFARGTNPMVMDPYDGAWPIASVPYSIRDPRWERVRANLGYARSYADRMNLIAMRPRSDLASSGYCLANPARSRAEYLIYLPSGGPVTVNLHASPGALAVEWFLPVSGRTISDRMILGGGYHAFAAPHGEDAVLYIHS
ncbi:MAG TPA: DUF6298 domain-containing protein [Gemmatimonadaceae bacterium]|nr:DUF6298 domain-containing protein [Gemmatimonadaceae bacterium]